MSRQCRSKVICVVALGAMVYGTTGHAVRDTRSLKDVHAFKEASRKLTVQLVREAHRGRGGNEATLHQFHSTAKHAIGAFGNAWLAEAEHHLQRGAFGHTLEIAIELLTDPLTRPGASLTDLIRWRHPAARKRRAISGAIRRIGMSTDQKRQAIDLIVATSVRVAAEPLDLRMKAAIANLLPKLEAAGLAEAAADLRATQEASLAVAPAMLAVLDRPLDDPSLPGVRLARVARYGPRYVGEILGASAAHLLGLQGWAAYKEQTCVFLLWEAHTVARGLVQLLPDRPLTRLQLSEHTRAALSKAGMTTVHRLARQHLRGLQKRHGVRQAFPNQTARANLYSEVYDALCSLLPLREWSPPPEAQPSDGRP